MLKFFIRKPVTTIMFVLFFVILGIVSFPKMNIERTPSVDFPYVTATFVYPGATSAEIESQVVKKAENAMSEVAGVKKITSQVYENSAFVIAEFNLGINVDDKANEVKAKIPHSCETLLALDLKADRTLRIALRPSCFVPDYEQEGIRISLLLPFELRNQKSNLFKPTFSFFLFFNFIF